MNPDDSIEADEALGRIRDLCQKLEARDNNSKVESWAGLPGDERVVIGGYESGVDACVNLARAGKKVTARRPSQKLPGHFPRH